MQEHKFFPTDGPGSRCKHCGAAWHPNCGLTCIDRPDVAAIEPRRRVCAIDDFDAIGKRLEELRLEGEAAMNHTETGN